jgi:hypothetical protein
MVNCFQVGHPWRILELFELAHFSNCLQFCATDKQEMDTKVALAATARQELGAALHTAHKGHPWHNALGSVATDDLTLP